MKSLWKHTNKYLLGLVVVLSLLVGFQAALLYKKPEPLVEVSSSTGKQDETVTTKHPDVWDPDRQFETMRQRMDAIHENMEKMLARPFSGFGKGSANWQTFAFENPFAENLHLKDEGDRYRATLNMPGLDEMSVDVNVEEQTLKISGTLDHTEQKDQKGAHFQSRHTGRFERSVSLAQPVKPDTLQVSREGKVLTIEIEKESAAASRFPTG